MPITSEWYNDERTIIWVKYDGVWTLEDFYWQYDVTVEKIQSVQHPVITILDFSTSGPLPNAFLSVGKYVEKARAQNNPKTIILGINHYLEILIKIFQNVVPKVTQQIKVVNTLEEALEEANTTVGAYAQESWNDYRLEVIVSLH